MTGVLTYILTFGALPELDRYGRPKMFYGQRIHDKCYRRSFFDAGQFVETWDDDGAKKGWCLYKMGCRGPSTYNSCSTFKWNNGVSYPIGSGHGCIGCSEENFWDNGPFYERLTSIPVPGIESTPDEIGAVAAGAAVLGVGAHFISSVVRRTTQEKDEVPDKEGR
jgi:hydrogenase small subunit